MFQYGSNWTILANNLKSFIEATVCLLTESDSSISSKFLTNSFYKENDTDFAMVNVDADVIDDELNFSELTNIAAKDI